MRLGKIRFLEETQGKPASHELLIFERVFRKWACFCNQVIGKFVFARFESNVGVNAPFVPPGVGYDGFCFLMRRAEQKLCRFRYSV